MKPWCVTNQMKAIEQYFHVVLFIRLYNEVPTFTSVNETQVINLSIVTRSFILCKSIHVMRKVPVILSKEGLGTTSNSQVIF